MPVQATIELRDQDRGIFGRLIDRIGPSDFVHGDEVIDPALGLKEVQLIDRAIAVLIIDLAGITNPTLNAPLSERHRRFFDGEYLRFEPHIDHLLCIFDGFLWKPSEMSSVFVGEFISDGFLRKQ